VEGPKPKNNISTRIDAPCFFINPGDPIPEALNDAIFHSTLRESGFSIISIRLPGLGIYDMFLIDDDDTGDRYLATKHQSRWEDWSLSIDDRKAEALALFVEACGSGMNHFDSWEDRMNATRLTEKEFSALYEADVSLLQAILSEP
jgi:hypothetical protein